MRLCISKHTCPHSGVRLASFSLSISQNFIQRLKNALACKSSVGEFEPTTQSQHVRIQTQAETCAERGKKPICSQNEHSNRSPPTCTPPFVSSSKTSTRTSSHMPPHSADSGSNVRPLLLQDPAPNPRELRRISNETRPPHNTRNHGRLSPSLPRAFPLCCFTAKSCRRLRDHMARARCAAIASGSLRARSILIGPLHRATSARSPPIARRPRSRRRDSREPPARPGPRSPGPSPPRSRTRRATRPPR